MVAWLVACLVGLTPAVGRAADQPARITGDVDVDGLRLHYYATGRGTPLVLLHHFGWSGKVWDPFVPDLAKRYRVVVVDLPGHGGSTGWDAPLYDYPRNAARVLTMLSAIGVDHFDAIGASLGSVTLLQMAVEQPNRIGKMVLVSSTPSLTPQTVAWLDDNACGPVSDDDIRTGLRYQTHGREQVIGLAKMFCNERANPLNITPAQMHQVATTALIVHGDRDRIFPVTSAMTEFASLPNAYLWIQPHAGHVFIFHDAANHRQFTETVLTFLSRGWGA